MALLQGGAQHGILPVGTLSKCGYLVVSIAALVGPIVLLEPCPFGGVQQIKLLADVAKANIIGIVNVCLTVAALSLLRSDEDDAVGATRTIDGRCRDVLQHLDTLDVVGVDGCQWIEAALDAAQTRRTNTGILEIDKAVDDVEWFVRSIHGVAATDADMTVGTRLTTAGRDVKTSHLTAQRTVKRWCL